ncbi:MAG: 30S ribosomal protein S20 [SAR324 cluster bacterium]|nr:30S ribosomal protein S20 [SAR324 cluster bacterium]MBF0350035.1 30S ribosomal protein S20 [SAR324 cluster bacterium]
MPSHKSAIKRVEQTKKRYERNRSLRSALRTSIKKFRTLLEKGDVGEAQTSFPSIQKTIDKAVTKGILQHGTAARYKSRLANALQKLSASKETASA